MNRPDAVAANGHAYAIVPLWSKALPHRLRGLTLARERGWLAVWDEKEWIYLLSANGQLEGQLHFPGSLASVCCADDGSVLAGVGKQGDIHWWSPDLRTQSQAKVASEGLSVAMDMYGQYLAVSDSRAGLRVFNSRGFPVFQTESPRPFHHLAFVPVAPYLIATADFGLVSCFELTGRIAWRDGLVAHVGSLTVAGDGTEILMACFTDGLQRYSLDGKNLGRLTLPEPCRLASMSFDGKLILVTGLSNRLILIDRNGLSLGSYPTDGRVVSVAIGPLGQNIFAALEDGTVIGLQLQPR